MLNMNNHLPLANTDSFKEAREVTASQAPFNLDIIGSFVFLLIDPIPVIL